MDARLEDELRRFAKTMTYMDQKILEYEEPGDSRTILEMAELARQVTENPIFMQAVIDMRSHFIKAWLNTSEHDTNVRDLSWRHVKFLNIFVGTLQEYIAAAASAVPREEMNLP